MQTRDDIFNTLRDALVELFELDPARVSLESNLYQDLEIDSIDAVDLKNISAVVANSDRIELFAGAGGLGIGLHRADRHL